MRQRVDKRAAVDNMCNHPGVIIERVGGGVFILAICTTNPKQHDREHLSPIEHIGAYGNVEQAGIALEAGTMNKPTYLLTHRVWAVLSSDFGEYKGRMRPRLGLEEVYKLKQSSQYSVAVWEAKGFLASAGPKRNGPLNTFIKRRSIEQDLEDRQIRDWWKIVEEKEEWREWRTQTSRDLAMEEQDDEAWWRPG